jgi:hypothetical protein
LIAIGLSVAFQAAALAAPLVHAHVGGHDSDHRHDGSRVHAHFSEHALSHHHSPGPRLSDDAERTVSLQLFVAVSASTFHLSPALLPSFNLILPETNAPRDLLRVVHGHDPPLARSGPSRAPPALLS